MSSVSDNQTVKSMGSLSQISTISKALNRSKQRSHDIEKVAQEMHMLTSQQRRSTEQAKLGCSLISSQTSLEKLLKSINETDSSKVRNLQSSNHEMLANQMR